MTGRTAHPHDAAVLVLESRSATRRRADLPADLGVAFANLQSAGLAPEIVDLTDTDVDAADTARAS